jgi:hypothetical protein
MTPYCHVGEFDSQPPAEVDGWRIAQDPNYLHVYWRCCLLVLEWNTWSQHSDCWAWPWRRPTPYMWSDDDPLHPARKALWEDLFVRPGL